MAKRKEIKDIKKRLSFDEAKSSFKDKKSTTKENNKGRVKLTTTINPEIRDELKILAIKKKVNLSDLIEQALKDFLKKQ